MEKNKPLKMGYIILCIATVLNFIGENIFILSGTHMGVASDGFLGMISEMTGGISSHLDGTWLLVFLVHNVIIYFAISLITFLFYRKRIRKHTAILTSLSFVPLALYYLLTAVGSAWSSVIIALGVLKLIYSILMIVFMIKDIRYLSKAIEE